ncbi:3-hydroxyacyl-CoA dehydrogenase family protein [Chloroflexota bacterium]
MGGINKIGIIGANEIATKIEELLSKAGLEVVLEEKCYTEELSDADVIIEALPAGLQSRKEILRTCGEQTPSHVLLATTALGGITEIAAVAGRPDRTAGLNFTFNPFEEKCLIQIVRGLETSAETIEACQSLADKTGATSIIVEDVSGLILERTMASVINEATTMYLAKVSTIEGIDNVTKLCLNWPMGPFEFADYIGIDNVLATLEAAAQDGSQYLPCRLLRQMAVTGRLGRKTGKGFYTYS